MTDRQSTAAAESAANPYAPPQSDCTRQQEHGWVAKQPAESRYPAACASLSLALALVPSAVFFIGVTMMGAGWLSPPLAQATASTVSLSLSLVAVAAIPIGLGGLAGAALSPALPTRRRLGTAGIAIVALTHAAFWLWLLLWVFPRID